MIRRQVNKFLENLSEGTRSVMSHYFLTSSISDYCQILSGIHRMISFRRLKRTIFVFAK